MSSEIIYLLGDYVVHVVAMMCEKYGFSEKDALRKFIFSETNRMLENPVLEMWEFAPAVIFELWECEEITGNPRNSIYIRSE